MLQIIEDAETWKRIILDFPVYDFYHTYDYHVISKQSEEIPQLLYYTEGKAAIAIPFLKRPISSTPFYDLTSVYGYAGPLAKNLDDEKFCMRFKKAALAHFDTSKIVSVFTRLNPLVPSQDKVLEGIGNIDTLGPMVYIDLSKSIDQQRTGFSKTTKRYLNKVRKVCYVVKGSSKSDIKTFVRLYHETMHRVNAQDYYFFNEKYFIDFVNSKDFETDLIFVKYRETDEVIAGAMMVKCKDIVQYHLSGTGNDYLHLTPLRLLIDEARIDATKKGYTFFNLGGGLGSKVDNLYFFKSSFSKDLKYFKIWKLITNKEVYEQLCQSTNTSYIKTKKMGKNEYFPLYRYNR